jgi:hypothetical protein
MNSNIPAKDALREAFASVNVTLNGEPAKICGFDNPFATVAQIPSGLSADWSWSAVGRIVDNHGGRFRG